MSSFTDQLQYTVTDRVDQWHNKIYTIDKPFEFYCGTKQEPLLTIKVPIGFETDLASVPWPLSLLFRPEGDYAQAAVVHDFILQTYYQDKYDSRITADAVFLEALYVLKVNRLLAMVMFTCVRLYGWAISKR